MAKEKSAALVDDVLDSTPEKKDEVTKDELTTLKEQVETATRETERERLRAEVAERDREDFSRRLAQEAEMRAKAQNESIDSRIAAKSAEAERLKRDALAAYENGKFDQYPDLVAEYGSTKQDIKTFEENKAKLERERAEPVKSSDPLASYTPKTRQWIEKNPEFLSDKRFYTKAVAAHQLAEAEGIPVESDKYFEYIENIVRPKKAEIIHDEPKEKRISAPPSRGTTNTRNDAQKPLTAEEREYAVSIFNNMSQADAEVEYRKQKYQLIEEGKLGRS